MREHIPYISYACIKRLGQKIKGDKINYEMLISKKITIGK